MRVAATSHRGRRDENEDVVFADESVVVLADGMGGHAGGLEAATVAVHAARRLLSATDEDAVEAAFEAANEAVLHHQTVHPEHAKAGCTLTIVGVKGGPDGTAEAIVAHAGDSPVYLLRGDEAKLLTPPHNRAEELRAAGLISEEEAATHPSPHQLQRSLGRQTDLRPDVCILELEAGDRLVVCSDGLIEVPDRERLWDIARAEGDLDEVVEELAEAALQDSTDNVTVALVEVA